MATFEHAAAPSTEPRSESGLGPLRLWWLLAATFTLYGLVWAYRQGKDLRSLGHSRRAPLVWAVSFLFIATHPFVLRRLAQEARQRSEALGLEPRVSPWAVFAVAALLDAANLVPFVYPLAGALPLALLGLLPLPVVLVQREIRRARRAEGRPEGTLSWPVLGVAVAGSVVVGAVTWFTYSAGGIDRLLGRSLPPAHEISGASGRFTVAVSGGGWVRVPPGRVGDANSDLELVGPDKDCWLIGYVTPGAPSDLDAIVARRAQLVAAVSGLANVSEKRFFYPGLDLAPASIARYDGARWPKPVFHVLTVVDAEQVVEVVGYAAGPSPEARVREMIDSVRVLLAATP